MLEILDSLIATIGVVLVLSLIVQAVQQIIKQVGGFKSSYMERELIAMFGAVTKEDPPSEGVQAKQTGQLKNTLMAVASISSTWLYEAATPASIKSRLETDRNRELGNLIQAIKTRVSGLGYNDLSLLESMKKEDFKKIVASLTSFSKDKLDKWTDDVEQWYDLTMKAFQDHYERKMKGWAYLLSFLVVVWLDANIFEIHKQFSTNKVLRDSAVKMAERLTAIPRDSLVVIATKGKKDSLLQKADSMAIKAVERQIAKIDSLVNGSSYQIMRWNAPNGDRMRFGNFLGFRIWPLLSDIGPAIEHNLFGWLAMALLVGLGAPFWYDFLKSVMGLKNALKSKSEEGKKN